MKLSAATLGFGLLIATVSGLAAGVSDLLDSGIATNKRELSNANGDIHGLADLEGRGTQLNEAGQDSVPNFQSLQHGIKDLVPTSADNSTAFTPDTVIGTDCCPVAGQNWDPASTYTILNGVNYLRGINSGCTVGARSCGRVSCSYNAAIYICNDNYNVISPGCSTIAQFAEDLTNICYQNPGSRFASTCGQRFDSSRFNVIVRADRC